MIEIIAISSIAGIIGTGLGGVLGILFGNQSIGKTLSFTGGIMIGIVFFDLMPLSLMLSDVFIAALSVFIGVFAISLLDVYVIGNEGKTETAEMQYINTGIILLISMGLHNFFEGMAIGSSGAENIKLGLVVSIVIAIHDIPEGVAIAAPLTAGKMKKGKVIYLTVISGLSTILGAILGAWLGGISETLHALCLGFAAGAMLYVVYGELLPDAFGTATKKQSAIMTILGIAVSFLILQFL
jgi:ZIP family zinc transporter